MTAILVWDRLKANSKTEKRLAGDALSGCAAILQKHRLARWDIVRSV